jgi:hypothetical protein
MSAMTDLPEGISAMDATIMKAVRVTLVTISMQY